MDIVHELDSETQGKLVAESLGLEVKNEQELQKLSVFSTLVDYQMCY